MFVRKYHSVCEVLPHLKRENAAYLQIKVREVCCLSLEDGEQRVNQSRSTRLGSSLIGNQEYNLRNVLMNLVEWTMVG